MDKFDKIILDEIQEYRSLGYTWKEVVDKLNKKYAIYGFEYDPDNLRKYMSKYNKRKGKIEYENKKELPKETDINNYWKALIAIQSASNALDTKQTKAVINIDDDKPIGVAFWGDWHIGGKGVDHEQFLRDMELIVNTDGLYYIGMGDYKDSYLQMGHKGAIYGQLLPPNGQDYLVLDTVEKTKEKALAFVRGQHDYWTEQLTSQDFLETLCEKADAVNLWHGGLIYVNLGDIQYKLGIRHKYKYESGLNTTNSQRRLNEHFGGCDVVAVGDKHFVDFQRKTDLGRKTTWLRSGTYKIMDEFGMRIGGYEGEYGIPMVILWPESKKTVAFDDLRTGLAYLEYLRTF